MKWTGRTVAVFGGSFDPPTKYHYDICWYLLKLGVNELRIVPAFSQPLKQQHVASFDQRVKMLIAMRGHLIPFFPMTPIVVDRIESTRKGRSFTIDTLQAFQEKEPNSNFLFVMGSDSLLGIEDWKDPELLCSNFPILSFPRNPEEPSSTDLRALLAAEDFEQAKKFLDESVTKSLRTYNPYIP